MTIPWDQLFDLLFKLIEDCGDDTSAASLRDRPVATFMGVTRSLRKLGFSGKNLRQARQEVMEEINDASDDELTAFISGGPQALANLR